MVLEKFAGCEYNRKTYLPSDDDHERFGPVERTSGFGAGTKVVYDCGSRVDELFVALGVGGL